MADVFISYAREDVDHITKIAEYLHLLGLEIWFDRSIPVGSSYNEIISQQLADAKAVLVCWSLRSSRSRWVMSEAMVAHETEKLVPFCIGKCVLMPPFNLDQAEDLSEWQGDWSHGGWQRIVERIGSLAGRPGLAGKPGAPGLCEAHSDASGEKLAVWARTYPDDPYASSIWPIWEQLQREQFTAELAIVKKKIDTFVSQVRSKFGKLEKDFDRWVALGPKASPSSRPDPKILAASLVSQSADTESSHYCIDTAVGSRQTAPPQEGMAQPRRTLWIAAVLVCGALLGSIAGFLARNAGGSSQAEMAKANIGQAEMAKAELSSLAKELDQNKIGLENANQQIAELTEVNRALKASIAQRAGSSRDGAAAASTSASLTPPPVGLASPADDHPRAAQAQGDKAPSASDASAQQAAAKAPAASPGTVFRDCADCPEMTVLAAVSFAMGAGMTPYDRPIHKVTIAKPFAMARSDVTFADWRRCLEAGGCTVKPDSHGFGEDDRPVVNISWSDAETFIRWLSDKTGKTYRLPSEAEWEYAAHGGTTTAFSWGPAVGSGMANCEGCGVAGTPSRTTPVRSFPPNGFGLYDMAGNAAEWVEDCWNPTYRGAPHDGSPWLTGHCEQRVLRGGSFDSGPAYIKPSARFRYDADVRYWANGFRVVRDLP